MKHSYLWRLIIFIALASCEKNIADTKPAYEVIERIVGQEHLEKFVFLIDTTLSNAYSVKVADNKIHVYASTQADLCRGAYDFLSKKCNSIVSWSGNNIHIPEQLPDYTAHVKSPFQYRYYFNVVTHGYSTAYWDWERWEKEIDWMAVHGLNMPLLPGAHEAILLRVFKKLGFTQKEIDKYFTGPAHFPWNKMGNITGWDGPIPESFFEKQIKLNHQILERLHQLEMHPIVPGFAGFVPPDIQRLYPREKVRNLQWGGFNKEHQSYILEPGSDLFIAIGKMYIEEYEREFGKQEFYLADSFNEMDVPLSADADKALNELATYGESVYQSIVEANPDATWVMQGWTFPFHQQDGELFWTPERLGALVSKVPDDKLLILDLANEYNRLWWHSEPSWKTYSGFFGKQWIYSFIPNMGGKTAFNGRLDLYATMPSEALNYKNKGNLVGYGFAPEGIENNEIIYELLADLAWENRAINLDDWLAGYSKRRYKVYPEKMKTAFEYFNRSCFGSFTDHPRNTYQLRPGNNRRGSVHSSDDFAKGVELFLSCSDQCGDSKLYEVDAIAFVCQYLGIKADELLVEFESSEEKDIAILNRALELLLQVDKLLVSHPNWNIEQWVNYAKKWGDTPEEKQYYSSNAKRLITTWGGDIDDYAAKTWSGLIRAYYVPRWKNYYTNHAFDIEEWEEKWITASSVSEIAPYDDPLQKAIELFQEHYKK